MVQERPDQVRACCLGFSTWLLLAHEHDITRDSTAALRAYERYLALAPRGDASRDAAARRVEQLRGTPR